MAKKQSANNNNNSPGYSRAEVYRKLRYEVYPRCAKPSSAIRMDDDLESDLGYVDGSKALLAPKTNTAFQLTAPNWLVSQDFDNISIVQEHFQKTCEELNATGRLTS